MTNHLPSEHSPTPPHPAEQLLPADTRLGPVHLDVTDGDVARLFWTRNIGLVVIRNSGDVIELGVDGDVLVVLHPGATGPVMPHRTGLYHLALHVPSQKELARVCARLYALGWEHAPTDHTETMATYCNDPDGNGIEITFATPERGSLVQGNSSIAAILADGTERSGTEPLDVDMLLNTLGEDDDVMAPMPAGTRMGHIHLHVNDMQAARDFYANLIGLGDLHWFKPFRMSDFSLQTSFVPHALAVNTWHGSQAQRRPDGTAGLRLWHLVVPERSDLETISSRLLSSGTPCTFFDSELSVQDPASNHLVLHVGAE